jgi:putative zinc finger protein
VSARHFDEPAIIAYVDGTLVGAAAEELEAHVVGCSLCAARLQRAAWVETAMFEAAAQMHPPHRKRSWSQRIHRVVVQMPAGLALAASLVVGLGAPSRLDLDVGTGVRVARADVGDGHGSTPWDEAPECEAPEAAGETCDDPTIGDDLLAMTTWPADSPLGAEPDEEPGLCEFDGAELSCSGEQPRDG